MVQGVEVVSGEAARPTTLPPVAQGVPVGLLRQLSDRVISTTVETISGTAQAISTVPAALVRVVSQRDSLGDAGVTPPTATAVPVPPTATAVPAPPTATAVPTGIAINPALSQIRYPSAAGRAAAPPAPAQRPPPLSTGATGRPLNNPSGRVVARREAIAPPATDRRAHEGYISEEEAQRWLGWYQIAYFARFFGIVAATMGLWKYSSVSQAVDVMRFDDLGNHACEITRHSVFRANGVCGSGKHTYSCCKYTVKYYAIANNVTANSSSFWVHSMGEVPVVGKIYATRGLCEHDTLGCEPPKFGRSLCHCTPSGRNAFPGCSSARLFPIGERFKCWVAVEGNRQKRRPTGLQRQWDLAKKSHNCQNAACLTLFDADSSSRKKLGEAVPWMGWGVGVAVVAQIFFTCFDCLVAEKTIIPSGSRASAESLV